MRLLLLSAVALLSLAAGQARADLSFSLDASNISGATGPFGTITLTDGTGTGIGGNGIASGTVHVNETLSPNVFANTGAAYTFEFSLLGNPTISTADITHFIMSGPSSTTSSFMLFSDPGVPNGGGYTGFGLGIDCSLCGSGTSPPNYNTLSFDITTSVGLVSTDFTTNTITKKNGQTSPGKYYFVSDIGYWTGTAYSTGYASADTATIVLPPPSHQGSVPEPTSLALLGTAVAGLSLRYLRRKPL